KLQGYNACYFCLGVSSIGKKEDEYTRLTYDLTLAAAKTLSRLNHDMTFCYVSGEGTDSTERGRLMWARVKGKTENDLRKLPFKAAFAFRPGFIKPIKGLRNAYGASKILGAVYPVLKALAPNHVCTLGDLGLAMITVTLSGFSRPALENKDIDEIGGRAGL
ncbi:MAG TPA: epimerase, partial [Bacteroidota bacterium]|nr:epimerase [Bacteroidota bacterium]